MPPPKPRPAPPRRISCPICGRKDVPQAHPEHRVCVECTGDPPAAAAYLATRRRALETQQHDQARKEQDAWHALSEAERDRWGAWHALRETTDRTEEERRRYEATREAYALPYHAAAAAALEAGETPAAVASRYGREALLGARVPPSLRRYAHEAECLFWANAALAEEAPRLDLRLADLSLALEALGRKAEADALYSKEEKARAAA